MTYCVGLLVDTGVVIGLANQRRRRPDECLSDNGRFSTNDRVLVLTRQAHHPNW
jgi:hypothetical protein